MLGNRVHRRGAPSSKRQSFSKGMLRLLGESLFYTSRIYLVHFMGIIDVFTRWAAMFGSRRELQKWKTM